MGFCFHAFNRDKTISSGYVKYFGYVSDKTALNSKSYQYLVKIGKDPSRSEDFKFWYEERVDGIELTSDEFKQFVTFLDNDMREAKESGELYPYQTYNLLEYPEITKLINTNKPAIIEWI